MSVQIEDKKSFSVIGKLGQGISSEGPKWIAGLWQEANNHFEEIRDLVKKDQDGNLVGLWGAMSDVTENFEPWNEQGKYLAGCEVVDNCIVPVGWTKWNIPAYRFAVIKCNQDTYQEKFTYMVNEYLPLKRYSIVAAVHEFYKPNEIDGSLYLYFPISAV